MIAQIPHPLVLGHRGAPRAAPENTLVAFDRAVRAGADGVELDVRPAADGRAVVIHDDDLERATGARGRVSALAWPAIERLTNAHVPSFAQAAAWAAAAGAWLNVEIKAGGVEREVVHTIRETALTQRVVISSFDPAILGEVGRIDPTLRRFLLTERWDDACRAALSRCGAGGICLHVDAATSVVMADLGRLDLPVIVWTVNDPDRVRRLLDEGAAGVISDDPGMAAAVRSERA